MNNNNKWRAPEYVHGICNKEASSVNDLMQFPLDSDERYLKKTDKIFESTHKTSIMIIREYPCRNNDYQTSLFDKMKDEKTNTNQYERYVF